MNAETVYLFRHAVVRDAAYQLQPPGDRSELHAFTVRVLQDDASAPPLDLAEHAALAAQQAQSVIPADELQEIELHALLRGLELARARFEPEAEVSCLRRLDSHPALSAQERVERRLEQTTPLQTLGRLDEAIEVCEDVAREADGTLKCRALIRLCEAQRNRGNLQAAEHALQEAEALGPADDAMRAMLETAAGRMHLQRNELELARARLENAETLARKAGAWPGVDRALNALSILHRTKEEYTIALECLDRLDEIPEALLPARHRATSNSRGNVLWRQGRSDEAEVQYQKALQDAKDKGDIPDQAIALGNLGNICLDRDQVEPAMRCFRQAVDVCREVGLVGHTALYTMALGSCYRRLGNPESALAAYDEAEALNQRAGNLAEVSNIAANKGLVHADLDRFDLALAEYERAERIARQANSPLRVASHLSRQADLFAATSRPEQAVDLYRKSLALRREHGAEISRPDAQLQIALVALLKELGRIDEARAALRTAQEYAEQSNLAGQATRTSIRNSLAKLAELESELA